MGIIGKANIIRWCIAVFIPVGGNTAGIFIPVFFFDNVILEIFRFWIDGVVDVIIQEIAHAVIVRLNHFAVCFSGSNTVFENAVVKLTQGVIDFLCGAAVLLHVTCQFLVQITDCSDDFLVGVFQVNVLAEGAAHLNFDGADGGECGNTVNRAESFRHDNRCKHADSQCNGQNVGDDRYPESAEASLADDFHQEINDRSEDDDGAECVNAGVQQTENENCQCREHQIVRTEVYEGLGYGLCLAALVELPCGNEADDNENGDDQRPADEGRNQTVVGCLGTADAVTAVVSVESI